MNKIFKTKYDITTGQCKAVSELASNRQIASSSESKPKCGVFFGGNLGAFKVLPLALVLAGFFGVSSVSYADIVYIDMDGETGAAGVKQNWSEATYWKDKKNILITPVQDRGQILKRYGGINTNVEHSVIIGPNSAGRNHKQGMTILGYNAVGYESQATALGNNVYSAGQGVALGSDVMAAGLGSIAIGNDDIYTDVGFSDTLPEETILKIYGYRSDDSTNVKYKGKISYKDILDENDFKKKYVRDNHIDTRVYSPTYSAGVAAIAIGSRSVAYGDTSLSIGTLSFALGKSSTAVGVRAFVDFVATGGVAIGDESRVFAANSFAVGNNAESTNKGALSFGSFSKAVGEGSIAIGQNVGSNAKLSGSADTELEKLIMSTTQTAQPTVSPGDHGSATIAYDNRSPDKQLKFGDKNEIVTLGFAAKNQTENPVSKLIDELIKKKEKQKDQLQYAFDKSNGEIIETTEKIYKTQKEGDHAISLGYHISNNGDNTIAIGSASIVRGSNSVVLGALNNIGKYARNTIALGIGTNVYKENSVAIGTGVNVAGAGVVAIGSGVGVTKDNTIAVGYGAHSLSSESIVLGNDASLKDHASESIVIGHHAQVEHKLDESAKQEKIEKVKRDKRIFLDNGNVELEMSAIAIGADSKVYAEKGVAFGNNAQVEQNASSAMALGNDAEATMKNSVALGYKSTTKYFYEDKTGNTATITSSNGPTVKNDSSTKTATLDGKKAIELAPYIPEGSSYDLKTDEAAGIVSVGWIKNGSNGGGQELGLRRIVGVAPGALDSDVATIGQLKALAYVKKEGVVTYYTEENGNIYKVVKDTKGNFYKVNTDNGTPLDDTQIDKNKVFAGPKGANEKPVMINGKKTADMGELIKFGHIADGEIADKSNQAITGNQLNQLGKTILGLTVNSDKTKFDTPSFVAVNYEGAQSGTNNQPTTFKKAIDELITAVNKGLNIAGDAESGQLTLGSTLTIKAGNTTVEDKVLKTTTEYKSDNIRTAYQSNNKTLLIGIKENPTFKKVTLSEEQTYPSGTQKNTVDKNDLITKGYLDGALKNVATSFNVQGDSGAKFKVQDTLNIKGADSTAQTTDQSAGTTSTAHKNITTKASSDTLEIALNEDIKEVNSIAGKTFMTKGSNGKQTPVSSSIEFNGKNVNGTKANTNVVIKSNGANFVFDRTGLTLSGKQIKGITSGLGLNGTGNGNADIIDKVLAGTLDSTNSGGSSTTIANNAVNVKDLSEVAKAIVQKGLTFAGNTGTDVKASLGDKITIKGEGTYLTSKASSNGSGKEITFSLTDKVTNKLAIINVGNGSTNGDNSFALGKNSTWEGKTTAATSADINVGSASLKFDWNNAGAGADKEVVSVGSQGNERIIKHVAAGSVMPNSTDAINGGQVYSVIETFGKLGVTVLGAEVDSGTKQFKATTFTKLKDKDGSETSPAPTTFKQAIEKSIETINKGLKFKGDKSAGSNNEAKQLYLGSTLTIKGAESTAQTPAQGAGVAKHQNITTTAKDGGILEIALNTNLKDITSIGKDGDNVLTFANGASGSSGGNSAVLKVGGSELTFTKADGNKVTITGLADGKSDGDAVTVKQLTASQLHYLSVKNGTSNTSTGTRTDNYNNDGAKGDKSIAIGVNTKTDMGAIGAVALGSGAEVKSEYGVAIGHGTVVGTGAKNSIAISATKDSDKGNLQNAEWAISIGNKNNVSGGNDIVALGSNITISKNNGKSNDSVIAIGNTVTLQNAKQSIGVGRDTKITNAEWAVSIGNNNSITGGNDIVALGSNITVSGSGNDSVLVFGNSAKAESASNSVVIGREAESKAQSAVVLGKGANVKQNATGAVAIGEGATVEENAGDSVALGKNSKASDKKNAPSGAEVFAGKNSLKITWASAGTSSDMAKDKTVVSVGDKGSERIITNVAAGKVETGSTDAINGGQLAEVISIFGKLGFDVLGAEKHDTDDGFKQSTFAKVEYKRASQGTQQGQQQEQAKAPTTFREAINESITAINKGLMFSADQSAVTNGTQNTPHYLGSTLSIVRLGMNQAGSSATPAPAGTSSQPNIAEFKGDNLITQYTRETNGNAKIEIGFKNAPIFEKVTLSQKQMYENGTGSGSGASGSTVGENDLITKGYLEQALNKFKFKVENGSGKPIEIGRGDTLKFTNGQNIQVTVANGNGSATQPSSSASASAPAPTPAAPAPSPAPAAAPPSASASSTTTTPTTSTTTTGTPTAPTTAVVTIATTDTLENIKSISSPKGSAGGNGAGSNEEVTKLSLTSENATFQVGTTGAKVNINKEGIALMPQGANNTGGANGANPFADTASITIKAGAKPADPKSLDSLDPNNGPSIEFSAKKTSDGKSIGTGKITGLKDLEANSDGTSAVNKNYVDKLDKVTVKYDDEHKKSITLGGKPQNGGKAHDPVAINNLKSGLGLDDMKDKPDSQKNGLSFELVKKLVAEGMSGQQGQQMTKDDLHKAANLADLKAVAQAGLRFKGNQGDDVVRKISDTLTIKGEENATTGSSATDKFNSTTTAAGNIKVETNTAKDGLEIKLSDTLKNMKAFETKEEGGKKSTLNSEGLTVENKGKDGNSKGTSATYGADNIMLEDKGKNNKATITAESLTFADNVAQNQQNPMPKTVLNKNGLTVTGKGGEIKIDGENGIITVPDIKPTTSGSAVVNKKYVDGQLSATVNRLDNVISANNKRLQSGIAGANAAAALPTIAMPGKSALAVSAGTYRGQSAVALGYSRVSDNGKIMLKLHGNSTSTGDFGGGVGIGWAW
ncbi:YadA domain protein [Histophilus somni 2336]|uniref:YadA-like family protein n=1 Tax=Histophilus somni TaxID=731 RepID=UPI000165F90B|nr:YadA-like family protein [Histophilus somni]ACA31577.1 YadA domain protein [Histophilus somni 2336]